MTYVEESAVASSLSCLLSELLLSWLNHNEHTHMQAKRSSLHIWSGRGRRRRRDMFPSATQMVFVREPSDVDLGESPSQSTHSQAQTHTYTYSKHTQTHSRVNTCGDSSHRQSSRSEPHLLLDLPHTHAELLNPGSKPNLAELFIVSLAKKHTYTLTHKRLQIGRDTCTKPHTQAHHKRTTSTWRQPPPISHGWLVLCPFSVNSWNSRTHTATNTQTSKTRSTKAGRAL